MHTPRIMPVPDTSRIIKKALYCCCTTGSSILRLGESVLGKCRLQSKWGKLASTKPCAWEEGGNLAAATDSQTSLFTVRLSVSIQYNAAITTLSALQICSISFTPTPAGFHSSLTLHATEDLRWRHSGGKRPGQNMPFLEHYKGQMNLQANPVGDLSPQIANMTVFQYSCFSQVKLHNLNSDDWQLNEDQKSSTKYF